LALYRCQIFKTQTGDRFWTNVYHFNVTTIDAAAAFANTTIAPAEASLMDGTFRVVKTLISDPASDEFVTTPLNIVGGGAGSQYLPLFNTVKVNVSVDGHGRVDYKFYRGGVTEGNQNNGMMDPATIDAYDDMVNGLIADGAAAGCDLVDSDGNLWVLAVTQPAVQMRQLHRKRKKVVTP
jgi:hypothetical protein